MSTYLFPLGKEAEINIMGGTWNLCFWRWQGSGLCFITFAICWFVNIMIKGKQLAMKQWWGERSKTKWNTTMNGRIRQKEVTGKSRNPLARFWKGCSNQLQGTRESFKADSQAEETNCWLQVWRGKRGGATQQQGSKVSAAQSWSVSLQSHGL